MALTQIPVIDTPDWAERLLGLFPASWTSDEAKSEGGVLYSLFLAIGDELERSLENVNYDFAATRIATAVDTALDSVAKDYFGAVAGFPADVIRAPGEPDESLRTRVYASLLLPAATRQSLIDLLTRLTGEKPRVFEPWSPGDTSSWDNMSYLDIDTEENPSRMGDPGLKYQGFVESILPSFGNQGDNPVYAIDMGSAWDAPSGYLIDPQPTWWLSVQRIDALINKTKPYGTTVWRKYRGSPLTKTMLGSTLFLSEGTADYEVEVFPAFAGQYIVLANTNWNCSVSWIPLSNSRFKLIFSTAAPANARVDWVAAPISLPGVGIGPLQEGGFSATIGIQPIYENFNLFVSASVNSNIWLHSRSSSAAVLRFSSEIPQAQTISYAFIQPNYSGRVFVPAGSSTVSVAISSRDPFQAFSLPTWNTAVDIDKQPTVLTFSFTNVPEEDSFLYWGIHES